MNATNVSRFIVQARKRIERERKDRELSVNQHLAYECMKECEYRNDLIDHRLAAYGGLICLC